MLTTFFVCVCIGWFLRPIELQLRSKYIYKEQKATKINNKPRLEKQRCVSSIDGQWTAGCGQASIPSRSAGECQFN